MDYSSTSKSAGSQTALIECAEAKIYAAVYPRPNAETIILLHGGPGVPMDFSPLAEPLSRKFQVVTFDQRGTGRSPVASGATFSIDEYLQDIDTVAQHFGANRFHLFGHSWGGLYAQIYAQRNPPRVLSLFLSSPSSGTGDVWKQTEREVMLFNKAQAGAWGWLKMGMRSLLGLLGSDTAYQSLFKQVLENYNKDFDASFAATDAMVENVRALPINKTRPQIVKCPALSDALNHRFPILVAYGQKDIYGESKSHVRNRLPNATFVEVPNAGHLAWQHNPAAFLRTLYNFYGISP